MSTTTQVVLGDHEIPIIKRGDDNTSFYDISVLTNSDLISPFANVREIANHIRYEKTSKGNKTTHISLAGLHRLVSVLVQQLESSPNAMIGSQLKIVNSILPVIQYLENEKSSSLIEKENGEQALDLLQSKDDSPQTSPLRRPKASSHILTPSITKIPTSSSSPTSSSTLILSPIFPSSSSLLSPNELPEDTFEHQQNQQEKEEEQAEEEQQEQEEEEEQKQEDDEEEQKKCEKKNDTSEKYKCDCGKTFTSSQAKAGHCHFCVVHQANRNKTKMGLNNAKRQRDEEEYDESYSSDDTSRDKYKRTQRGREPNTLKLNTVPRSVRMAERNASLSLSQTLSHSFNSMTFSFSENFHINTDLCENGKRVLRSPIPSRSSRRSALLDETHLSPTSDCEEACSADSREEEEDGEEMEMDLCGLHVNDVYFDFEASNNARFHQCYHRTVQSTRLICADNERLKRLTERLVSRMECLKEQQNVI